MTKADIGLIGLAVMGENLVLNMASKGFTTAVFNRTTAKVDAFLQGRAKGLPIVGTYSLQELAQALKRPRKIMLMVKAGQPVDNILQDLVEFLEPGDIIIDGGNSLYTDTSRRVQEIKQRGIHFVGAGVSGGEEGALHGPSIMPGGAREAWDEVKPVLQAIAAQVEGDPCCEWIGPEGAGHFVKMVHNGIEYADMQLIGEAYFLMKHALGLAPKEMQAVFQEWNRGELESYLIEITASIMGKVDADTGTPLVELICDAAGQKGTGKWTSQVALDLGVSAPTIVEAVMARIISGARGQRAQAQTVFPAPSRTARLEREEFIEAIRSALFASKICAYAQGFDILQQASNEYGWNLQPGVLAMIWRGGCIIRAQFLHRIKDVYDEDPKLVNLLFAPYFAQAVAGAEEKWRKVVSTAVELGLPVPAFSSALAYFDALRTGQLWTNLVQAQRDYFGAHTYQRTDKPGTFHTNWQALEEEVESVPV
ncbi:MAG TPA: NADP-dependent phosphogluconate dehydrogenase [Firmicutes bacterium]|jgi:6-phosphogluconate dehydrogenase|nr:MAG: 6-phosphogluconate dehydrogenase [Peptococcaceae bacterium 1109]HHT72837.1 NADP-dependent phosphogluconate dehydrogenase [Bacillota bacterium]